MHGGRSFPQASGAQGQGLSVGVCGFGEVRGRKLYVGQRIAPMVAVASWGLIWKL